MLQICPISHSKRCDRKSKQGCNYYKMFIVRFDKRHQTWEKVFFSVKIFLRISLYVFLQCSIDSWLLNLFIRMQRGNALGLNFHLHIWKAFKKMVGPDQLIDLWNGATFKRLFGHSKVCSEHNNNHKEVLDNKVRRAGESTKTFIDNFPYRRVIFWRIG